MAEKFMVATEQDDKKSEGKRIAQRLKYVRKQLLNLTQEAFCAGTDLPKQTYAIWESVRFSGLTKRGAERVLKRYQELGIVCTQSWLLHGIGAPPCQKQESDHAAIETLEDIAKELLVFASKAPTLDLYVTDNTMAPFYEQGDTVAGYITSLKKADTKNCIVLFAEANQRHKTLGRVDLDTDRLIITYAHYQSPAKLINIDNTISIAPVLWYRKPSL